MNDSASIWLPTAEKTVLSGASLGQTLYAFPVDIQLRGELGAGKTHFLQGLAKFLGIQDPLTSPTYALEQRYETNMGVPFIHIDCYRLSTTQSHDLLQGSDNHAGIRAIEWADRLSHPSPHPTIVIDLKEEKEGRRVNCSFHDAPMPSRAEILQWRKEAMLPKHIQEHCDVVADMCDKLSAAIQESGRFVRPKLLRIAAELHDLFRFIDFKPGAASGPFPNEYSDDELRTFAGWKNKFPDMKHEEACAFFMEQHGYHAPSKIIKVHGLFHPSPKRPTIEQKLLFYADKRVKFTEPVSLEERFADFHVRYAGNTDSNVSDTWFAEAKEIEQELFPEGPPEL